MKKCIFCKDFAEVRMYFHNSDPVCDMHYAGYLECLLDELKTSISDEEKVSAYHKYRIVLEPRPITAKKRVKKLKKERREQLEATLIIAGVNLEGV